MKKLLNLRFPVLLAAAILIGVAIGYLLVLNGISLFWITAVIPITAVIYIVITLKSGNGKLSFFIILTSVFFVVGAVNCYSRLDDYCKSSLVNGGTYTVTATVSEKGENSRGEYIIIKNVIADGEKTNGKIMVYLGNSYGDFCDVGYKVTFTADISQYQVFYGSKLNYYAQENVKYVCSVYGGLTSKYGFNLFGNVRSAIRKTLYNNLDKDTAAIAFAMLTGDTQGVDDGVMINFRYGGIAHIFAVSGLHIGIIYGILKFFCKKLRINKYLTAALCIVLVLLYAGVCGFTISSLRAAVMCTVAAVAGLAHKKYDGLNALCLSVIIILLLTPLSMFSVGFQLSVISAGSIILLSKNIARPFKKLPKNISNAASISISAQSGTLPVLLYNFGYLSGAGLLLNIIVLPLLTLAFVILFICTFISTVFSFAAAYIIPYAALPLELIVSFFINTGFENTLISGFVSVAFIIIYFAGLFALSDKIRFKALHRVVSVIFAASLLCISVLIF